MVNSAPSVSKGPNEAGFTPFLFSDETIAEFTDAEKRGEYTLERLHELRPEAIKEIIRLRGQYVGMLRIAKIVRVHHKTVAAVDAAYPEEITAGRQRSVHRMRSAADKLIEQIDDTPENVPWNVKALAASQLIDKAELLDGRPTARVEQVEAIDIYADWEDFIASNLPQNSIDIVAVKVSETHSLAGKESAIKERAIAAIAEENT